VSDPSLSPSFDETGADLSPLDEFSEIPAQGDPNVEPTLVGAPEDNLGTDLEMELDEDFESLDPLDDELDEDELEGDELEEDDDVDQNDIDENDLDDEDPLDR